MASEIGNQFKTAQRIVLPVGINIASNTSPSLPAINGSLAMDAANPGIVYVGNGDDWADITSQDGYVNSSFHMAGIGMTSNSQPAISNMILDIGMITTPVNNMINLSLYLAQSVTITSGPAQYTTASAVVPVAFRPAVNLNFPYYNLQSSTNATNFFTIQSNGFITLSISASSGIVALYSAGCVYQGTFA